MKKMKKGHSCYLAGRKAWSCMKKLPNPSWLQPDEGLDTLICQVGPLYPFIMFFLNYIQILLFLGCFFLQSKFILHPII